MMATGVVLLLAFVGMTPSTHGSPPNGAVSVHHAGSADVRTSAGIAAPAVVAVAPTPDPTTVTTPAIPTTAASRPAAPSSPAPTQASVDALLVARVEASGILPGPDWSWSVGDTSVSCHIASSTGQGTGCTSWSSGSEVTVFDGPMTLALVAHELANAETEAYAIPPLLDQVSSAAGASSWSATDAVASCLVAHYLGVQDGAAGPWQCPATLAAAVATHIHDTVVTNRITATCGVSSGVSSSLTFSAGGGTVTVTSSAVGSVPQTASAGGSVVVSGIGTFVAEDVGGTGALSGVCQA